MATQTTTKELRKMTPADLLKEIRQQDNEVVKLRLGVQLGKEKDSAKYVREKKQLARMKTVYSEILMQPATEKTKEIEASASKEPKKAVSSAGSKTATPSKK